MRKWAGALAVTGLLAGAPPAFAAPPIDLGVGDSPAVVVDGAGTAHIVFNSASGETYCRLPRTAKACDILTALPLDRSVRGPLILQRRQDGALFIVQGAGDSGSATIWARYSLDGGATWQGPIALATGTSSASGAALAADGQSLFTLDPGAPGGLTLQRGLFAATESSRARARAHERVDAGRLVGGAPGRAGRRADAERRRDAQRHPLAFLRRRRPVRHQRLGQAGHHQGRGRPRAGHRPARHVTCSSSAARCTRTAARSGCAPSTPSARAGGPRAGPSATG